MKVTELIERLADYPPDMQVFIVSQPDRPCPLEYSIRGVDTALSPTSGQDTCYIIEGSQRGYGPRL